MVLVGADSQKWESPIRSFSPQGLQPSNGLRKTLRLERCSLYPTYEVSEKATTSLTWDLICGLRDFRDEANMHS